VPNIVVEMPLPASPPGSQTITVTVKTGSGLGLLSVGNDNGNVVVGGNHSHTLTLTSSPSPTFPSGSLGAIERALQTLTYTAVSGHPTDTITISATDYFAGPPAADAVIQVHNNSAALVFDWTGAANNSFADPLNWSASGGGGLIPPGGTNVAAFGPGNHTVSGAGAVGEISVTGTTTLTGQVTAQGHSGVALAVDGGGALTLAGGALLAAQQQATVGGSGQGLLALMGGTLALTGPSTANALVIGQSAGSNGTVLDLEQITAAGTVVVGAAGTGTLELLGVAASIADGGADIGQSAGAHGSVIVNGGEWTTSGQLTVGDAGTGSLLINGMVNGTTGQATAFNAMIGAQAGSQGSVMLDGGELLVANVAAASSTLAVGAGGTGDLAIEDGSEVAVGAAIADNNGRFVVGGTAGGRGQVRVGGNSQLLVYGSAAIGGAAGAGQVTVGESANDTALFALIGTLAIGGTGQMTLGGANATVRASAIDIASGGLLSGAGTLSGDAGGNNTVALASIDNESSITASGGNLLLYGAVTGTGTLAVASGATMTLQAAVGAGQRLAFSPNARAVLNDPRAFAGTITGFGAGDVLDVAGTEVTSLPTWSDGVLMLDTAFGPIRLNFAGAYASNAFAVQADGHGGTYVLAGGNGDVHMTTFDGLYYDFQAVGDFVAVRSTDAGQPWQIQIRTASFPGATSITTGLAATLGDDRVSFAVGRTNPVYIDGAPDTALQVGDVQSLAGGTLTQLSAASYRLAWNTGQSVTVTYQDNYMDWTVALAPHDGPGSVQGLLGSHSGQASDFQRPDGSVLRQPLSNDELLGAFADGWRVPPGASLLDDRSSPALLLQYMSAMGGDAAAPVPTGATLQGAMSPSAGDLAAAFTPSSAFHA
jgi:T5SS/PEP-CTERM-associated repeat protein